VRRGPGGLLGVVFAGLVELRVAGTLGAFLGEPRHVLELLLLRWLQRVELLELGRVELGRVELGRLRIVGSVVLHLRELPVHLQSRAA
jgi:hypothetical protein